ncbi:MAG: cellulase family glycosylhydrolase, partial [Kiritimatiellae bacterium]|nr:cellulase family glycosylhydrolase [Kiritimatiellia bacterium]
MKSILRHCPLATLAFAALCAANAEVAMPALSWTPSNNRATVSGNIATIALPGSTPASSRVNAAFDMSGFAGKAFELTVNAQLSNIGNTTYSWDGLKFQFSFHDDLRDADNTIDGSLPQKTGTSDGWIQLRLRFDPSQYRTTKATLGLGIQHATGTARFDLSSLAITEQPAICEPTNENYVVQYPSRVADAAALRGVMSPTGDMNEGDFRTLHDWGATLLRFEMANCPSEAIADIPAYLEWARGRLDHLESVILPCAEKYGLLVVVDLHNTIGGRIDGYSDFALMDDDAFYDAWLGLWREIAARFKGDKRIYGYDLCNEPNQTAARKRNYWQIQQAAAEAIRAIDPDVTIVMEANATDAPDAFHYLSPLSLGNVVYQVHMYEPGSYTHQGLDGNPYGQDYPGTLPNGDTFDKAWLRAQLAPVRAFQQKHGARILVGEFSAICWAPGADQYLADLTSIFDEYGWDWCYMAFRAWGGWSLEHQERNAGVPTEWDFVASPDNARKRAILAAIANGAASETVSDYLRLTAGQKVTLQNATNDNASVVKRIVFAGGAITGTSFNGRPFCTANGARWRLEGENGAPILVGPLGMQRIHWHTGDGFVETRGGCDVVFCDDQYNAANDFRGTVWLDDARTAWDHTGDFVLSNAVKVVCRADDCLPHGNGTGGILMKWVNRSLPAPVLDLGGHSVAVNELNASGGGILANSSSARATLRFGENDLGGMLALDTSQDCRTIDIEKTGSGQNGLDVGSSAFGDVRLESGRFLVRGAAGDTVSVDALSLASGARLVVKDTTLYAASFAPGGTVELQGTGRFIYGTLAGENRPSWFSAVAATDVAAGGAWVSKPPISAGAYAVGNGSPAVFAASEERFDFPRVEAAIMQEDAWPADCLGDLLADAVSRRARAKIVAVEEPGGAEPSWCGLVGS